MPWNLRKNIIFNVFFVFILKISKLGKLPVTAAKNNSTSSMNRRFSFKNTFPVMAIYSFYQQSRFPNIRWKETYIMDSLALDKLINSLEHMIDVAHFGHTKWKPIWGVIRQIGGSFKGTYYPTIDDRQEAWDKFQSLVQRVKHAQAEEQQHREGMADKSERHKYDILACASAATPPSGLEEAIASIVVTFPRWVISKAIDTVIPGPEIDETRETLGYCSKKLQEGWHLLSLHKQEMLGRDKKEAFEALKQAQELLDDAWDRWKSAKQGAKQAQQETWEARREAWETRVQRNIENLKEKAGRLYGVLAHKEGHLEELQEKRDSAWNDNFRELVEGWIDEEEENIRDIREKIDRIENWIEEEYSKIQ